MFAITALLIDPVLVPSQLNWASFAPIHIPDWGAFLFVAVAMAGFVNAVNMADGQNGIVVGTFVIWAICVLIVAGGPVEKIALVLVETCVAVLAFNLRGKVFLGDAGTYGVTFVFGLIAIAAHNQWGVSAETVAVWFFLPVTDCLRLMVARSVRGELPSKADRDHFHHRLAEKFGGIWGLVIYLSVAGSTSILATLMPHLALVCMLGLTAFYFSLARLSEVDSVSRFKLADKSERTDYPTNVVQLDVREGPDSRNSAKSGG